MFQFLAIFFEGMPLISFCGIWVGGLLLVVILFLGYRKLRDLPIALAPFYWTAAGLFVVTFAATANIWHCYYDPPLTIPAEARFVKIDRSPWLVSPRTERMSFQIEEPAFIRWVESLTHYSWQQLPQESKYIHFREFRSSATSETDVAEISRFDPTRIMDTKGVRTGLLYPASGGENLLWQNSLRCGV